MDLKKLIKEKIEKLSPHQKDFTIPKKILPDIIKIQEFLDKDNQIYQNRKKYNIKWAFKNAQKNMNNFFDVLLSKTKCKFVAFKQKNPLVLDELKNHINFKRKKILKRKLNSYTRASFLMSLIDIVISIILILIITKIGHLSETLFDSVLLGLLFFAIIILLKVTLDRRYIVPTVQKWGWKKFKKINNKFTENISIILAFLIIANNLSEKENSVHLKTLLKKVNHLIK